MGTGPGLEKSLEGFRHQSVRQMAGMGPKRQRDGAWVYTTIRAGLEMLRLEEIGVYTARHQKTFAQYIATRTIVDLCLAANRNPGLCLYMQRWDHTALDILWIRAGHVAAEGVGDTGTEESEGYIE